MSCPTTASPCDGQIVHGSAQEEQRVWKAKFNTVPKARLGNQREFPTPRLLPSDAFQFRPSARRGSFAVRDYFQFCDAVEHDAPYVFQHPDITVRIEIPLNIREGLPKNFDGLRGRIGTHSLLPGVVKTRGNTGGFRVTQYGRSHIIALVCTFARSCLRIVLFMCFHSPQPRALPLERAATADLLSLSGGPLKA